jgi:1,4-dihydroxy-2-naphthoate polyprenyltransferase
MTATDTASRKLLDTLEGRYTHAVIAFVDEDGYPMSVATNFVVAPDRGVVILDALAGDAAAPPLGHEVNVVFSHIRPVEGYGYDERRYVSLWGTLHATNGSLEFVPEGVQHWDEQEISFFEYSERSVPQAHRYLDQLSRERGEPVRPKLSPFWLFLRATRLPFLSATIAPVGLGIAVAGLHGHWHWGLAVLTIVAAALVHLGLNVANDVFDTQSGADAANVTPTQFSGGSRVIHYGLLSMTQMRRMSVAFYGVGLAIGIALALLSSFWPVLIIGVIGAAISYFYTAPPLRLVHRGLGELAVFLGFGPIMALGAYEVQAKSWSWEALYASIPVGILVTMILYVNEIPDRPGDAAAGKRTLPVRWPKARVIQVYVVSVVVAFALVFFGAVSSLLPVPAIIALAAFPLMPPVAHGLRRFYHSPYELMPLMGKNIQLHAATSGLLILGYVIAIIAAHTMSHPPIILR